MHLFLELSNLLDDVLSQLNVIGIELSDVHYLVESYPAHPLLLNLGHLFQNSIFFVIIKRVLYNFGIQLFTLILICTKTHDSCKGDMKEYPIICLCGCGFIHLMLLFVIVKSILLVDVYWT